jgi:ribosomal protein L40E
MIDSFDANHTDTTKILEAQKASREAKRSAGENQFRIEELEKKCERLTEITETLWSIISNNLPINSESFQQKLLETIALRESRKIQKLICANCSQRSPIEKPKCIYCGYELRDFKPQSVFDI